MRWLETLLERRPPADETSVSDVMAQAFSAAERGDYASALELWEPLAEFERSEEHTSELQSPCNLVCRLLLEKKKNLVYELERVQRILAQAARGLNVGH